MDYRDELREQQRQWEYNHSEAGRARQERYRKTEKGRKTRREADTRWRNTAEGRANKLRNNERRQYVGEIYLGMSGFSPREMEELKANGKID